MVQGLRTSCHKRGIQFQLITSKNTPYWPGAAYHLRDADYCFVWHGMSPWAAWAVNIRRLVEGHLRIVETGWFAQADNWHFDTQGIIGASSLCGPLGDAPGDALERKRDEYEKRIKDAAAPPLPEGSVLVPMQLTRDVAVYGYAPFKTNTAWADHVLDKFPDTPVVFKTHPKQAKLKIDRRGRDDVRIVTHGEFAAYARQASRVYGQTSTALYEAALVGCPVTTVGRCPLWYHSDKAEQLLRVMCHRQFPRVHRDYLSTLPEFA